ncbi:MAG: CysS/YqeB C-terminal domain-containing protein [Candidatus Nanopelagicales bacterium]
MSTAPAEILALADARAQARADKDFARSDELRDEIAAAGWLIKDTAEGYALSEKPPFDVAPTLAALVEQTSRLDAALCTIGVIVDAWPDDLRTCLDALMAHAPDGAVVMALDLGNVDGAGLVLHEFAIANPARIVEFHCAQTLQQCGWSAAVTSLLQLSASRVHIIMDLSSVLEGDAVTPLVAAIDGPVVGAAWKGANVDVDDAWRSVTDAGPGEVDVLLGYFAALDREAALATPPHPKAKFYRNADLEWSLALRAAGGSIVVPTTGLPVRQDRHRGYHDSDLAYRDKESRKTYDRILQAYRGHDEILHR